ncbi:uncharacterized protein LOC127080965 [Lathyrus oleraceus]|uniref:uncharacterized protein LOC127080965 n=1 Tax=Pisum sativum TaxID=3888 RepID=UPI0021D1DE20|nr:uncharacterized protein LOC127080965 [Pisum sativum]
MDLIKNVGLMKTVAGLSQCYEGLVKELVVNIPEDIADKNSKDFCKVFVRGKCITFSPTLINKFLGRGTEGACELEATKNEVCREITARQVKEWPSKKHLPVGKLTVKYAILHKIGSANWVPTNHISTISNALGKFIFVVGTKLKFDYGRFTFEQVVKHASTNALKLPIAFPSRICGIILSQHPGILSTNDLPSRRKPPLSVHYKLFEGIRVATTRKEALEALIASLEQAERENIGQAKEDEAQTSSERDDVTDDLYDTDDVTDDVGDDLFIIGDVEGDVRWGSVMSVVRRLVLAGGGGGVF